MSLMAPFLYVDRGHALRDMVSCFHDRQVCNAGQLKISVSGHALCPLSHLVKVPIQPCDYRVEYLKRAAANVLVQWDIVDSQQWNAVLVHILYCDLHLVFIACIHNTHSCNALSNTSKTAMWSAQTHSFACRDHRRAA